MPHRAPWDWRVSLYTWTKGVAAGVWMVALGLVLGGLAAWDGALWGLTVPVLAGVFLALTGALLVWDLEHPGRFWMIFARPQWRSWLVKGGFVIGGYSLVLALQFVSGMAGGSGVQAWLAVAGAPLAALTAVYTAYLFAQAKARDLWQNPLGPVHMVVKALLLGAALLLALSVVVAGVPRRRPAAGAARCGCGGFPSRSGSTSEPRRSNAPRRILAAGTRSCSNSTAPSSAIPCQSTASSFIRISISREIPR